MPHFLVASVSSVGSVKFINLDFLCCSVGGTRKTRPHDHTIGGVGWRTLNKHYHSFGPFTTAYSGLIIARKNRHQRAASAARATNSHSHWVRCIGLLFFGCIRWRMRLSKVTANGFYIELIFISASHSHKRLAYGPPPLLFRLSCRES